MKRTFLAFLMTLSAGSVSADDVSGLWQTATSDSGAYLHVEVAPCGNAPDMICGRIAAAFNSARSDLVGKPIIWNMQPSGENKWRKGTVWAPDDDKTYNSNMELNGNTLSVEGCIAIFCRGQDWTRIR